MLYRFRRERNHLTGVRTASAATRGRGAPETAYGLGRRTSNALDWRSATGSVAQLPGVAGAVAQRMSATRRRPVRQAGWIGGFASGESELTSGISNDSRLPGGTPPAGTPPTQAHAMPRNSCAVLSASVRASE